MKLYNCCVHGTACVEVEANSEEEASELAIDRAFENNLFNFDNGSGANEYCDPDPDSGDVQEIGEIGPSNALIEMKEDE